MHQQEMCMGFSSILHQSCCQEISFFMQCIMSGFACTIGSNKSLVTRSTSYNYALDDKIIIIMTQI